MARQDVVADGSIRQFDFDVPIQQSSWVAVRILPSSHTNPIFVLVDGQPVRGLTPQWYLARVNQCWTQKAPKISAPELPEAQKTYDHARQFYKRLISECRVE